MLESVDRLTADMCEELDDAGQAIGPAQVASPRFDLFHAASSICSQKVRVVLVQHGIGYTSHMLNIFTGQTYLPSYVRLRMVGCESRGGPLVTGHSGSTAVSTGGCDPAVVPTLVDREAGKVIVDSKAICLYLDAIVPEARRLRPAALHAAIDAELDIVDDLPNYQMLTGRPAGTDLRPEPLRGNNGVDFAMSKVQRCDTYLAECAEDALLVKAYQAKRAKELDAAEKLFSEDAMESAYAKASSALTALNARLEASSRSWLLGLSPTMADLYWALELLRMKNLGAGIMWEQGKLPAVEAFVTAAERLESVRSAVLDWPGSQF